MTGTPSARACSASCAARRHDDAPGAERSRRPRKRRASPRCCPSTTRTGRSCRASSTAAGRRRATTAIGREAWSPSAARARPPPIAEPPMPATTRPPGESHSLQSPPSSRRATARRAGARGWRGCRRAGSCVSTLRDGLALRSLGAHAQNLQPSVRDLHAREHAHAAGERRCPRRPSRPRRAPRRRSTCVLVADPRARGDDRSRAARSPSPISAPCRTTARSTTAPRADRRRPGRARRAGRRARPRRPGSRARRPRAARRARRPRPSAATAR